MLCLCLVPFPKVHLFFIASSCLAIKGYKKNNNKNNDNNNNNNNNVSFVSRPYQSPLGM
jgi:hypothetical protein